MLDYGKKIFENWLKSENGFLAGEDVDDSEREEKLENDETDENQRESILISILTSVWMLLLHLINMANESNSIRVALEDRLEAANAWE